VKTKHGNNDEFKVKVHQGSVLSVLLFMAVMEALAREAREDLPWELLYVNSLVLVAEGKLKEKILMWNEYMEAKDLKINISKTKMMVSGKNCGDVGRTESGHALSVGRVLEVTQ